MGKHPDDTSVIFQEVELEYLGRSGLLVPEYRSQRARETNQTSS
ncbi:hypothetical protein [Methylobacterium nodulans]